MATQLSRRIHVRGGICAESVLLGGLSVYSWPDSFVRNLAARAKSAGNKEPRFWFCACGALTRPEVERPGSGEQLRS